MFKISNLFLKRASQRYFLRSPNSHAVCTLATLWVSLLPSSPLRAQPETDQGGKDSKKNQTTIAGTEKISRLVVISEMRNQGPGGISDSFVELANNSAQQVDISGWSLSFETAEGFFKTQIPAGTSIPVYGHYLLAGAQYSLGKISPADGKIERAFTGGIQLRDAQNRVMDAVGPKRAATEFREGDGLNEIAFNQQPEQFSCVRRFENRVLKDSNDNASDFFIVSTSGKIENTPVRIGAPGPENIQSAPFSLMQTKAKPTSPADTETQNPTSTKIIAANNSSADTLIPEVDVFHRPPLRERQNTGTHKTFGVLKLRCRLVNITAKTITRLNFRINGITNIPTSEADQDTEPTADVRFLPMPDSGKTDSTDKAISSSKSAPELWETVLDEPPFQPMGGGLNSSVSVRLPQDGLLPGAACDLEWAWGVERRGHYRVILDSEHFHITFDGDTEDVTRSTLLNGQKLAATTTSIGNDSNFNTNSVSGRVRPVENNSLPSKPINPTQTTNQSAIATAIIVFEGNTEDEFEPVEPARSALAISSFQVRGQTVALRFAGALDPQSANDIGIYTVQINDKTVELESASYDVGSNTISLILPTNAVRRGDTVFIKWTGLKDAKGGLLNGQAGPAKAS